jgi:hypothetical protein
MAELRATPYANPLTGLTNDAIQGLLAFMQDKKRTQQLQGLGNLLESTGIPKTVERAAYADSPRGLLDALTNINRANVPLLKPETAEALLTVAPLPRGAGKVAMAAGRAGERVAERVVPKILERGGLPAEMVQAMGSGTQSAMLPPAKFVGKPLEGLLSKVDVGGRIEEFGTDQRLVDIAKDITEKKGLVYSPQLKYAEVDPDRAKRLADAYDKMENNPSDKAVKKAYDAMIEETMEQYETLRKKGYTFSFMPESGDIYGNPRNAINDIVQNQRLSVFPTEQGFGTLSEASQANPLLMRIGEKWDGKEVTANDVFRAVHDVFGHGKHGVGFRAGGEENAFQAHARMYSPEALPAVTSETRGQNSWVNYGPFGEFNRKASPLETIYADQKTGIMPNWTYIEGLLK